MLEAASALVEASKEEDFKPSVESLSRAFNSVSYTHLDVYKRQRLSFIQVSQLKI